MAEEQWRMKMRYTQKGEVGGESGGGWRRREKRRESEKESRDQGQEDFLHTIEKKEALGH